MALGLEHLWRVNFYFLVRSNTSAKAQIFVQHQVCRGFVKLCIGLIAFLRHSLFNDLPV